MAAFRLFTGVPLPGEYQDGLERLTRAIRPRLRSRTTWTKPGNWHVTLQFLGNVEKVRLDALKRALVEVVFAPFSLRGEGAGMFPEGGPPRVLWVGLAEGAPRLAELAAATADALLPLGFPRETRPYRPHLTLCRVKSEAGDPWREIVGEMARVSWPVYNATSFTLWRSVPGPDGPKYAALAEFGATSL